VKTAEAGRSGEDLALNYLISKKYKLIERNYRAGRYEIDLIMRDKMTIVFAEVKARHPGFYGSGREAVGWTKQQHIITAAKFFCKQHECFSEPLRFDVVEVDLESGGVTHIEGAFCV
jgi:putative endonuclease